MNTSYYNKRNQEQLNKHCSGQTKNESFFEIMCNVVTGQLTATATWYWIVISWSNMLMINTNKFTFWQITLVNFMFTLVSIVRSYLWRRFFNKRSCRKGGD